MHFKEIMRIDSSEMAISVGFEFFLLFLYICIHTLVYVCLGAGGGEETIFASYREEFIFLTVTCPNNLKRNGMIL